MNSGRLITIFFFQFCHFFQTLKWYHQNVTTEIAWDLIQLCPKLAFTMDHFNSTPLHALAGLPSSFRSGAHLNFWQQWIYDR